MEDEEKHAGKHHEKGHEHHKPHKQHVKHKHNRTVKKTNVWKITTIILIVLLGIMWFTQPNGDSMSAESGNVDQIANDALELINENLLGGLSTATLEGAEEEFGLVKINLNIQGQPVESYVTKDGKYLFPQKIDLTESIPVPNTPEPSEVSTDMETLIDDDSVKGSLDAPVTIVEWSDYECSFCARFFSNTLGQIDEEYIKTGKVKFVYRDYPLPSHSNAQKAAEAAECAGEQGKYYEMHDKLFIEGSRGGVESYKGFAADIGLDQAAFDECLDSGAMAEEVKKDMADGTAQGIRGTPGFIINGKLVSGAQPYQVFKEIIDAELEG